MIEKIRRKCPSHLINKNQQFNNVSNLAVNIQGEEEEKTSSIYISYKNYKMYMNVFNSKATRSTCIISY